MSDAIKLVATAAFGLEAVVARELRTLGYEPRVENGRVRFAGPVEAIARANLWLRTAERVVIVVGEFPATDFGALFEQTSALPWEAWLPPDAAFPVTGRSHGSQLSSVPACQRIVKRAIVERLRRAHGVQQLPESGAVCAVDVALRNDTALLTLDTTGAGLHKRGYRTLVGAAPLRETLAAGLILLSYWTPQRPLLDPFCGSGTVVIEAALIGRRIAPGLRRTFAAEAWPTIDRRVWDEARREAHDLMLPALPQRLVGTDQDAAALRLARYHAERAGVADDVHFQQRPFAELHARREFGCLITNPPYGERLHDPQGLRALYESMPEVFRRLRTWSFFILTAWPDFETLLGQKADRRRKLYNGRIECTYYQFRGPPPMDRSAAAARDAETAAGNSVEEARGAAPHAGGGQVALAAAAPGPQPDESAEWAAAVDGGARGAPRRVLRPVFGGLPAKTPRQAEEFRNRLAKRARHLRRWPRVQGITCFRLYDRDVAEVPLAIDRYEDHLHVAEYQRPHDHTPAQHADWLDHLLRLAAQVLDVPRDKVFFKRRRRQRRGQQYQRVARQGYTLVVREGGLRFEVNLSDYVDTGLFLDHRLMRGMIRQAAAGKRFLNLFGYTGAFTVYAAAGGAASTCTVDWSKNYLTWAQRNLQLNGFSGPAHRFVCAEAREFLQRLPRGEHFDLVVVDPPTYSNSKRTDRDWDVQRDHAALLRMVLQRTAPGGVIYFSCNFRRFKLDEAALSDVSVREISRQTVPPDFRNRRIHRAWRIVKPV
jgi:23S rRNA (guanine2445-N2)-methyltransferase / 23S rRNA (guanine2069-N7)-methyltransferase